MDGYESVSRLEIDRGMQEALVRILERVRGESRARLVFLVEACGRPLAVSGEEASMPLDQLASLAASTAAAASGLAALVGEPGVTVLLQRGEQDVLRLVPTREFVLGVVFGKNAPQGLERLRSRLRKKRALRDIRAVLSRGPDRPGRGMEGVGEAEIEATLASVEPDPAGPGGRSGSPQKR